MQATAATRWLPKLEKQPDKVTLDQIDSSFTQRERYGLTGVALIMQGLLIIITSTILYEVAKTPTIPWDYGDGLALAALNLFPAFLLGITVIVTRSNFSLCPQGHLAHRSLHSRYCHQCGLPLLTRQPL